MYKYGKLKITINYLLKYETWNKLNFINGKDIHIFMDFHGKTY